MSDSATGMGEPIMEKGNWFMYNTVNITEDPGTGTIVDIQHIQAGNPKNGSNIIGELIITKMSATDFVVTYEMMPTIEIDGLDYNIVVTDEHLAISDAPDFTAKPGKDDNADFGDTLTDVDGNFYIFAHFEVVYLL